MVYLIIGKPGSGKSTECAALVQENLARGLKTYSNLRFDGAYYIDINDLGLYRFSPGSVVILDEAGILLNNRNFSNFPERMVYYFKMSRHYGCDIYVFSQEIDIDKKVRDVCEAMYLMTKTCIPMLQILPRKHLEPIDLAKYKSAKKRGKINRRNEWFLNHGITKKLVLNPKYCLFVHKRKIKKDIYFNKEEKTVSDGYELVSKGIITRLFFPNDYITRFAPKYWKYFNSFAMPDLPLIQDLPWSHDLEVQVLSKMLIDAIEADESKKKKVNKKSTDNKENNINLSKEDKPKIRTIKTPNGIEEVLDSRIIDIPGKEGVKVEVLHTASGAYYLGKDGKFKKTKT